MRRRGGELMVYRIYGRSKTGKTEYIKTLLGEKCQEGASSVVIVPVQESMDYEKDIFRRFGDRANAHIEVLTFDRLPNRTYREYGNLAFVAVDDGGRALYMARAAKSVREKLTEFAPVWGEGAFVGRMLETSQSLKENNIHHRLFSDFPGNVPFRARPGTCIPFWRRTIRFSAKAGTTAGTFFPFTPNT